MVSRSGAAESRFQSNWRDSLVERWGHTESPEAGSDGLGLGALYDASAPNLKVPAWVWPLAVPLSNRKEAAYGRLPILRSGALVTACRAPRSGG
jgi:hypothetical protein